MNKRETRFAIKKNSSEARIKLRWVLIVCILVSLLFSLIGIVYFYKQLFVSPITAYFTHAKTWVNEHKDRLNQNFVQVQRRANQTYHPVEQPIHFKFYTTLPNMKVVVSEQIVGESSQTNVALNKSSTLREASVKEARLRAKTKTIPIVDATELERELAEQIKQNNYIIKLGVFRNEQSAKKYLKTVMNQGFRAKIVVIGGKDKTFYRVQLGPYATRNQALLAQRKLKYKGVNSLISKLYP